MELSRDPYLRMVRDFPKPGIGLTVEDIFRQFPGPCLARNRDYSIPARWEVLPRKADTLLCKGACAGISETGICYHARRGLRFLGFIEANLSQARVSVMVQGAIELPICSLTKDSLGQDLYSVGPNEFSLEKDGFWVGKIFRLNPERIDVCMVVFSLGKKIILDQGQVKFI